MRNLIVGLITVTCFSTATCFAMTASELRNKNCATEGSNGLLQPTGKCGTDADSSIDQINQGRMASYHKAAKDAGVSVEEIQRNAAQKLQGR